MLALRYREQLGDTLVETGQLLDELRILLDDPSELLAKRSILSSLRC